MNDAWLRADTLGCEPRPPGEADEPSAQSQLAASVWKDLQTVGQQVSSEVTTVASTAGATLKNALNDAFCGSGFQHVLESLCAAAKQVADKNKPQWTIALNLTTDFDHDKDGKFYRLEDLKAFAEKTKGKSLAVVVQAAFKEPKADDSDEPTKYRLERYLVKDGTIKRVSVGQSKGYAQDLEDLVDYTSHHVGSHKLALIMDSHGIGNEGLLGDTGRIKLDDFVKRVQSGLKGSGREKLDLIDFDSCLMAQNGVLNKIRTLSNSLVASAELEPVKGLNLTPLYKHLVEKPDTDARALGRDVVNEGRLQADDKMEKGEKTPIRTIAHIDLTEYESFRKALDSLGEKLTETMKHGASRRTLEKVIDSTRRYDLDEWWDTPQADLKDFLQRIVSAVDDGRLPDPDRSLKKAANETEKELSKMIDAFYGHKDFRTTGGVSVFLPTWHEREERWRAQDNSAAGKLMHWTEAAKFEDANKNEDSMASFNKKVQEQIDKLTPFPFWGDSGYDKEFEEIKETFGRFRDARDSASRKTAFTDLHEASVRLENTKPFRIEYEQNLKKVREGVEAQYKEQLVDEGLNGWSRFQRSLRRDTPLK